jgi:hypothetical protein
MAHGIATTLVTAAMDRLGTASTMASGGITTVAAMIIAAMMERVETVIVAAVMERIEAVVIATAVMQRVDPMIVERVVALPVIAAAAATVVVEGINAMIAAAVMERVATMIVAAATVTAGVGGHEKEGIVHHVIERGGELAEAVERALVHRVCHIGRGCDAGRRIGGNRAVGAADHRGACQEGGSEEGSYAFDHHLLAFLGRPEIWTDIARGPAFFPCIVAALSSSPGVRRQRASCSIVDPVKGRRVTGGFEKIQI